MPLKTYSANFCCPVEVLKCFASFVLERNPLSIRTLGIDAPTRTSVSYTHLGIELKTSGGDIDVRVPADFDAKALLRTSGGDVDCNLVMNNVTKLSETKIDANINKGGKPLIAETSGGDVSVYKK